MLSTKQVIPSKSSVGSIADINETIQEGRSLKFLTQSYTEVAATKLRQIRAGIEKNRNFLNEIATLYATVKLVSTQRKYTRIPTTSHMLNLTTKFSLKSRKVLLAPLPKPSPKAATITILLTSNYRFYGNLEQILIEFFLKNAPRFSDKSIVIGRTALEFLRVVGFKAFTPLIFKRDMPSPVELHNLINQISSYERILVFHSKFQSVLTQTPFIKDIKEAQFEVSIPKKRIDYIFEPEIDKMLGFFDTQISSILLEQTFLESELARTGARVISMTNAQDNANEFLEKQQQLLTQTKRSVFNARLLDALAGSFQKRRDNFET